MKVYRTPFSLGYWRDALRDLKDLRKLTFAALMIAACMILNKFKIPLGENLSLSVTFLARALCATRSLLLLDEPVAGLDPLVTREMYDVIRMLHRERGLTVVMISHDVQAAMQEADHILHLSNSGSFYGTPFEYRHSDLGLAFFGGCCCHE